MPSSLPAQPAPLIGREDNIVAVTAALRRPDVRLLTLTGVGGIGKTRLALAAAERLIAQFPDGVAFVDLQPIREPERVIAAVARTLGVVETAEQPLVEGISAAIGDKRLLLLLDNFEQVLPGGTDVAALLGACPRLTALATSRAPLRVRWEHEWPVPPLAPSSAAALFTERARAVRPDLHLGEGDTPLVEAICDRLDGLPLAIELAAARTKLSPPDALLPRLQHRLSVLTGGARDAPVRQRTIANAIAWSYDLLGVAEQRLFRRLAVFTGGATLEMIEEVCAEPGETTLDDLAALVDSSLLSHAEASGGLRFRMLETVREYSLDQLAASDEHEAVRERHAQAMLALALRAEPELRGPRQIPWLERLDAEHDNIRAALTWSLDERGDLDLGLRLAVALEWFWQLRSTYAEGRRWLEALLNATAGRPPAPETRAQAMYAAGSLARFQGDMTAARPRLEESIALFRGQGDIRRLAHALHWLARTLWDAGERTLVRLRYDESIALARQADDRWLYAMALCSRASVSFEAGDATAEQDMEESFAICRQLGDAWATIRAMNYLGLAAYSRRDLDRATAAFEEQLALSRELGNTRFVMSALDRLGFVALERGDCERAAALFHESAVLAREIGFGAGVGPLVGLAAAALGTGRPERAARLLGAEEALRTGSGLVPWHWWRPVYERTVAGARAALGKQAFQTAWDGGRRSSDGEIWTALLPAPPADHGAPAMAGGHRPAPYPDGLTAREVEVLRLLATGKSNREIAEALVLSVRTAERHIANIYEKIGAHDKTARATATAYAFRHGLIPPT